MQNIRIVAILGSALAILTVQFGVRPVAASAQAAWPYKECTGGFDESGGGPIRNTTPRFRPVQLYFQPGVAPVSKCDYTAVFRKKLEP